MNSNLQVEFEEIVEENLAEFGMEEDEAVRDAALQLAKRPYAEFLSLTRAQRARREEMAHRSHDAAQFASQIGEITRMIASVGKEERNMLIFELLVQGGLGGAIHAVCSSSAEHDEEKQKEAACDLICLVCDSCALAKSCVPAVAIEALVASCMKKTHTPPCVLRALLSLMRGHEDNKQAFYEKGFNALLHELLLLQSDAQLTLELVREYCLDTALTQISNNSFTRCRKLGEDTCVVSVLAGGDLSVVAALDAVRLVCVNDALCALAIRHGALDKAITITTAASSSPPAVLLPALSLVRQLCLNDEAKRKIGAHVGFIRLLLDGCVADDEEDGEDEDDAKRQMALAILCAVELRQPGNCARLAELGAVDAYIQLLRRQPVAQETAKLALMALRNMVSHPDNIDVRQQALSLGAEQACRGLVSTSTAPLKVYVQDCLRDLGLANYKLASAD